MDPPPPVLDRALGLHEEFERVAGEGERDPEVAMPPVEHDEQKRGDHDRAARHVESDASPSAHAVHASNRSKSCASKSAMVRTDTSERGSSNRLVPAVTRPRSTVTAPRKPACRTVAMVSWS